MIKILMQKFWISSCSQCNEKAKFNTRDDAREWRKNHLVKSPKCKQSHKKLDGVRRWSNGKVIHYSVMDVACPVCGKSRLMQKSNYKRSLSRYSANPEFAGICKVCRLKVIKPAQKGYGALLLPVEQRI